MKKTLLLAIGLTLIFLSCKKDNNDDTTLGGAFPKTIVEETIGSIGTVKTTETYTLSGNKITAFERKVVDNGTPTTDEVYTITYNGELISNYNYYGDYYRDPLIRTVAHNVVSYTKNLHNNTQTDYKDLENASRTFSYQWNSNNTPKSAEYKKNNAHKATYTYTY